jgi:hypothetical protein
VLTGDPPLPGFMLLPFFILDTRTTGLVP